MREAPVSIKQAFIRPVINDKTAFSCCRGLHKATFVALSGPLTKARFCAQEDRNKDPEAGLLTLRLSQLGSWTKLPVQTDVLKSMNLRFISPRKETPDVCLEL